MVSKTFCSSIPKFKINNWEKAEPLLKDFLSTTRNEKGCIYYGFVRSGDVLITREAYVDGPALLDHVENVGSLFQAYADPDVAELESISIQLPSDELDTVESATEHLGTVYYELVDGFTNMKLVNGKEDTLPYNFVSLSSICKVKDWDKALSILSEILEATRDEEGCLYYSFARHEDTLLFREAYVDAAATNLHLRNTGLLLKDFFFDGSVAKSGPIEVWAPRDQIETLKPTTETKETTYYEIVDGFCNFSL